MSFREGRPDWFLSGKYYSNTSNLSSGTFSEGGSGCWLQMAGEYPGVTLENKLKVMPRRIELLLLGFV